jgi:hypothetical protein
MTLPKYSGFVLIDYVPDDNAIAYIPSNLLKRDAVPSIMVNYMKVIDANEGRLVSDGPLKIGKPLEIPRSSRQKTTIMIASDRELNDVVSFNGLNGRQNLVIVVNQPNVAIRVLFKNKNGQDCAHYYM